MLGQWFNQTFNAIVNYTNRNAKSEVTVKQIAVAYAGATSGAVAAAAGMNLLVEVQSMGEGPGDDLCDCVESSTNSS